MEEENYVNALQELINHYEKDNTSMCYNIAYSKSMTTNHLPNSFDYDSVVLLTKKKPHKLKAQRLEQGYYLVAYHFGHWHSVDEAYQRIANFASKQNLTLDTHVYELDLIDSLTAHDENEYLSKVFVRILDYKS